jgi:hypothetical protein
MDQVSRPLLIALLATAGLAVAWLAVLRPGDASQGEGNVPAAGAPATAGAAELRKAPPPTAPVARAATPGDVLARQLDRGRSVVLLFAGEGADDAAARRAVRAVRGPDVAVRVVGLAQLDEYAALGAGAAVTEAPTTLVIGADRRARRITGLTDARELRVALRDARRR